MNCSDFASLIDPFLDGELDLPVWLGVHEHLAGCAECRRAARFAAEFDRTMRERLKVETAPGGVVARVRARLSQGQRRRSRLARMLLHPASGYAVAAALLVVLILPLGGGVGLDSWRTPQQSQVQLDGRIVCVECEQSHRTPEEQRRCRMFSHHPGIRVADGTVWTLANRGAGAELGARPELRGAQVRFHGTLYPSIRTVHVSDFTVVPERS